MKRIEAALLFTTQPVLAFEHYLETLNQRLAPLDVAFAPASTEKTGQFALVTPGMKLTVTARNCPLPAASFQGALDGVISERVRGPLSDVLRRHGRYVLVNLQPIDDELPTTAELQTRLRLLRVAYIASHLICELHQPAAVHWRQSGQLLLGPQFLDFRRSEIPWALFARAERVTPEYLRADDTTGAVLRIDDCYGLVDRPIEVALSGAPGSVEQGYAAALAFLRHVVQTGHAIGDGARFGPDESRAITVAHIPETDGDPAGLGRLSSGGHTMPVDELHALGRPYGRAASNGYQSRTGKLAQAAAMVAMPPLGLAIMVSNAVLGASYLRNGLMMLGAVGLAVIVAAWSMVGGETSLGAQLDRSPISVMELPAN